MQAWDYFESDWTAAVFRHRSKRRQLENIAYNAFNNVSQYSLDSLLTFWEWAKTKHPKSEAIRAEMEARYATAFNLTGIHGTRWKFHPVEMARRVRSWKGAKHLTDSQINDVCTWQAGPTGNNPMPRCDPQEVQGRVFLLHGFKCEECGELYKSDLDEGPELPSYDLAVEGRCPICQGEVSRRAYVARRLATRQANDMRRAASEKRLAQDEARQKRLAEQRQKAILRKVLEKAAYEAIKEMGMLPALEEKFHENAA